MATCKVMSTSRNCGFCLLALFFFNKYKINLFKYVLPHLIFLVKISQGREINYVGPAYQFNESCNYKDHNCKQRVNFFYRNFIVYFVATAVGAAADRLLGFGVVPSLKPFLKKKTKNTRL